MSFESRKCSSTVEQVRRPRPNDLKVIHAYIAKGELPPLWHDFDRFTVNASTPSQYPCFDHTVCQYILSQAEVIVRIPKGASLVNFVEQISSPPVFVNLENIAEHDHERALSSADVFAAYFIHPKIWKDTVISQQTFDFIRAYPECFVENTYRVAPRSFTLETVQTRWPKDIIKKADECELSVSERHELIYILQRELFFCRNDLKRDLHFSQNTSRFLQQHHALFTPTVVRSLAPFSGDKGVSPKSIEQAWIDGHKSTDLPDFVSAVYGREPLIVLDSFRHYSSCSETEKRLLSELNKKQAVIVKLNFPSGAEAVFACKFEEVIIAVCVKSTSDLFKAGQSYLPIGKTLHVIQDLPKGEYIEFDVRDDQDPQIWAYNRQTDYVREDWRRIHQHVEEYAAKLNAQILAAK